MTSATGKPLLLEGGGPKPLWRNGEENLTSLPYIDQLTDKERDQIDALIRLEMTRSDRKVEDYLAALPPMPESRLASHPVLQAEADRVAKGEVMAPLDISRYRLDPPPANRRNDYSAWRHSLDNASAQLEHQQLRLLNLELMVKYGPNVWRAHNSQLDSVIKQVTDELAAVKADTDQLNKERKLAQTEAAQTLETLERTWYELVQKTMEIEGACQSLEREVEALRGSVEAAGVAKLGGQEAGHS